MKKSILFILPDLNAGGAERIVTTIANHLPRELFLPSILLLRKEGFYLDFLKEDVEIIDIKTPRIRHSLKPILQQIRKRKPDIVFSGFGEVNAYLSLFIKFFPKTKFIARETNVVSQHVTRKEIRFFYKFYNNYHKIICQSDDMKSDLIENFKIKKEKIIKINNPVDFSFIEEKLINETKPESYREDFKNVVAVGNLSSRKGFDNLLKVFEKIKQHKVLLHILGYGKDKELLHQMKSDFGLENVIFHGIQKNPYPFLKFADLFILSSRYEGFGMVLIEAMSFGIPCVSFDCNYGPSDIIKNNEDGFLVKNGDENDFAEKLQLLMKDENLRREKGEKARVNVERFLPENVVKNWDELFKKIVL